MDISREKLAGKTILEVGSGRGDTTRELVKLASGQPGAALIATDVSDQHLQGLRQELEGSGVRLQFICTGACELEGIDDGAVDYLVCNYTLCAVNTRPGRAALALRRFWEVLKPGGKLFVEEEFPIDRAETPGQEVWAAKWRLLKAATILNGGFPYAEFSPEDLAGMCRLAGFERIEWAADLFAYRGGDVLSFFRARLERLLPALPDDDLRAGFARCAAELQEKAARVGGMEVPFYRLAAQKGSCRNAA